MVSAVGRQIRIGYKRDMLIILHIGDHVTSMCSIKVFTEKSVKTADGREKVQSAEEEQR